MAQEMVTVAANSDERSLTILDVAREASVSKSTVSRVLNGSPHVATETRERVLETVSRLDFRANTAARGLRTTRSFLVGLLVPAISNDVFSRIAEVLEEDLRHEGVGLVIVSSGWDAGGERIALESLRDRRVDALVVSLVNDRDAALAELLASITRPNDGGRGPDRPARRHPEGPRAPGSARPPLCRDGDAQLGRPPGSPGGRRV
jgi:transcriptional regulator with XRE-family HTH domain